MSNFHTVVIPHFSDKEKNPRASNLFSNPFIGEFNEEIELAEKQKTKVYETRVQGEKPNEKFTFVTTSKNTHLDLGRLSYRGQCALAGLLEREFAGKTFGQLILQFNGKSGDFAKSILVARCASPDGISFGLSPAY